MTGTQKKIVVGLSFVAVLAASIVVARHFVLTGFSPYDDEGYLLISLQSFLSGGPLYNGVFTQYGPFYYQALRPLFAIPGLVPDNDTGHIITIFFWTVSSLILGVAIYRITGRPTYGIAAQLLSFTSLHVIAVASMHPGGMISLLLAALVLIIATIEDNSAPLRFAAAGAVVGALILVKVNIGLLAFSAFALTMAFCIRPFSQHVLPKIFVVALFVSVPSVLMAKQLTIASVQIYAAHVTIAALCCVVVQGLQPPRDRGLSDGLSFLAGLVAASIAVLAATALGGSSLLDILDGVLLAPLRHPAVYSYFLRLDPQLIYFDLMSLAAVLIYALRGQLLRADSPFMSPAQAIAGGFVVLVGLAQALFVCLWIISAHGIPTGFRVNISFPFSGNPFSMLAFAWLAMLPMREDDRQYRFAKALIVSLAVAESLHAYPVAGSQVGWSTFLLAVVALLTIDNGMKLIRQAVEGKFLWIEKCVSTVLILALIKYALFDPYNYGRQTYQSQHKLGLPGGVHLRLPLESVDRFQAIASAIHANCKSFIGVPGMNSFYIWTQMHPPTLINAGFWTSIFTEELQQRVVDEIKPIEGLCLLRNDRLQGDWTGGRMPEDRPLWQFVNQGFREVSDFGGDYKLYKRN